MRNALLSDPAVYERAESDWRGWWREQAAELEWFREPTTDLDDSAPPFYRWFADGTINASVNCLDRHVAAGRGERVAYHWRGEQGEERDITYAQLLADVQRFANALKTLGTVGRRRGGHHRRPRARGPPLQCRRRARGRYPLGRSSAGPARAR